MDTRRVRELNDAGRFSTSFRVASELAAGILTKFAVST